MSDLTMQHVASVLRKLGLHTLPSQGQREHTPAEMAERAADWWQILSGMGVSCAALSGAASRHMAGSRWRPEIADILAALRGPAPTAKGIEAIAAEDLAALDRWAGIVAGMGGVLPEWSAIRAAVADTGRQTRARQVFADVGQVDRIADAVYRLGGWAAMVRARTTERLPGSDPWRDYGFAWRSLYGGAETSAPSARMLTAHATERTEPRQLTAGEAQAFQAELAAQLARVRR